MGEITGKLLFISKEEKVSEKMKKREFVINVPGKYPKDVCFQLINDRVDIIDPYTAGDEITVSYELSSREYKGRYYTQANAWRIKGNTEYKAFDDSDKDMPILNDMNNGDLPF